MTYKELVTEVAGLSLAEQRALLQELSYMVNQKASARLEQISPADKVRGMTKPDGPALLAMQGILQTDGPSPTDEELREEYTNYLIKKYS
jgi:hypothetical protein